MAWTRKGCFVRHGDIFVRISQNRLQKVTNYLTENKTEAEQDYKDSEMKENIDSTTGISEEMPAVTEKLNEDSTQIIQNTPGGTREHTEGIQSIQRSKQKLKVNDIIQYKLKKC